MDSGRQTAVDRDCDRSRAGSVRVARGTIGVNGRSGRGRCVGIQRSPLLGLPCHSLFQGIWYLYYYCIVICTNEDVEVSC